MMARRAATRLGSGSVHNSLPPTAASQNRSVASKLNEGEMIDDELRKRECTERRHFGRLLPSFQATQRQQVLWPCLISSMTKSAGAQTQLVSHLNSLRLMSLFRYKQHRNHSRKPHPPNRRKIAFCRRALDQPDLLMGFTLPTGRSV